MCVLNVTKMRLRNLNSVSVKKDNHYSLIECLLLMQLSPLRPAGPIFTNIVSDSDFTYRLTLGFLTLESRLCEKSKVVFTNVPKARLYRVYKLLLM